MLESDCPTLIICTVQVCETVTNGVDDGVGVGDQQPQLSYDGVAVGDAVADGIDVAVGDAVADGIDVAVGDAVGALVALTAGMVPDGALPPAQAAKSAVDATSAIAKNGYFIMNAFMVLNT